MSFDLIDVSYTYNSDTSFEKIGLNNVSFNIQDGAFVGIAGASGSGKTTLVRLLKGLIKPSSGIIKSSYKPSEIGLVFQYPEFQLFESTVIKDVMFGPRNIGIKEDEAKKAAKEALSLLALDESFFERDPLCLSGGEKRRVAIAGILAMDPHVLILDEPTAGLDPSMHDLLFAILHSLNLAGKTIILVSHNMDDIATHCKQVVMLDDGHVVASGNADQVFSSTYSYSDIFLPTMVRLAKALKSSGFDIPQNLCTIDDMEQVLLDLFQSKTNNLSIQ